MQEKSYNTFDELFQINSNNLFVEKAIKGILVKVLFVIYLIEQ